MLLLESVNDWENYCAETSRALHVEGSLVNWGHGPLTYPALVASQKVIDGGVIRVLSCYVYPSDCVPLLKAMMPADRVVLLKEILGSSTCSAENSGDKAPTRTEWLEFCQSMRANILAIVDELIGVGASTEERYETKYNAFLSELDQMYAEDVDRAVRAEHSRRATRMIDKLGGNRPPCGPATA